MLHGRRSLARPRSLLASIGLASMGLALPACGGTGGSELFAGEQGAGGAGATTTGSTTGTTGTTTTTSSTSSTSTSSGTGGAGGGTTLCTPGDAVACYEGPDGTLGKGACKGGTKTCNSFGDAFGPCEGQVLPAAETCLTPGDDDCNGQVNEGGEGCACTPGAAMPCYDGPPGTEGVGACKAGTAICNELGTAMGPCTGQVTPQPETCLDPGDEDCNGKANEGGAGCACAPGTEAPCYDGPAGTAGVGACKSGTAVCLDSGAGYGACKGEVVPAPETCDTPIDDDCNGQVNEGGVGCACAPNAVESCYAGPAGTAGVGACKAGTQTCNALGTGWGACTGQVVPSTDSCATAADEDCNGTAYTCPAGQFCDPNTNACVQDPCAPGVLGTSNVGCEYYATATSNAQLVDKQTFLFGVSVANANASPATVTITKGFQLFVQTTVAAGSVAMFPLPWVTELVSPKASLVSTNAAGNGAYRVVSNVPVTVAQWSPTAATGPNSYSATVDTSLLLPVNAWGLSYRVASRNHNQGRSGFYAVVATQDGTVVNLGPSATGGNVLAGGGVQGNGSGTIQLNKGDVLQVLTNGGGGDFDPSDLTGTLVAANKPIEVIGGHDCTRVPYAVPYCDHLEEAMPPVSALGRTHVVTSPRADAGTPRNQVVRVIATQAGTTLSYEPPLANAPAFIANAGDYVELGPLPDSFVITASAKVLVAQYMVGDNGQPPLTDPSMSIAPPVEQQRAFYQLYAPPTGGWTTFVNVTAPTGATVSLDGAAVPANSFAPIGNSGQSWARLALSATGSHTLLGAKAIGAQVYGLSQYTSTFYPAGYNVLTLP